MAYAELETTDATYVYKGVMHWAGRIDPSRLEGLDAIVTEYAHDRPALSAEHDHVLLGLLRRTRASLDLRKAGIPVYSFDFMAYLQPDLKPRRPWDNFVEVLRLAAWMTVSVAVSMYHGSLPRLNFPTTPAGQARSAVVARRITSWLLPRLPRNPRIGIFYGLGHADILEFLREPGSAIPHLERADRLWREDTLNRGVRYSFGDGFWTCRDFCVEGRVREKRRATTKQKQKTRHALES